MKTKKKLAKIFAILSIVFASLSFGIFFYALSISLNTSSIFNHHLLLSIVFFVLFIITWLSSSYYTIKVDNYQKNIILNRQKNWQKVMKCPITVK